MRACERVSEPDELRGRWMAGPAGVMGDPVPVSAGDLVLARRQSGPRRAGWIRFPQQAVQLSGGGPEGASGGR